MIQRIKKYILLNAIHAWIFAIWLIVYILPVLIVSYNGQNDWNRVIGIWKQLIPFTILFILNHYVLVPFLLHSKRRVSYFSVVIILITLLSYNEFLKPKPQPANRRPAIKERAMGNERHGVRPPPRDRGLLMDSRNGKTRPLPEHPPGHWPPFISVFLVSVLVVGFDTGIIATIHWKEKERQIIALKSENLHSQLAFLRSQISPHFFMNTLNNIHSLIDFDTDEAKESVIKLSKLMRYLLYESNDELVFIEREFEFINSYVQLMQLRYSDKIEIKLGFPEQLPKKKVAPMIFTSIIENAFKHGISYKNHSFIHINFVATANRVLCEICNSKQQATESDEFSGIGVENTRKRLDLIYANDYQMDIIETETTFTVNLTIPLI